MNSSEKEQVLNNLIKFIENEFSNIRPNYRLTSYQKEFFKKVLMRKYNKYVFLSSTRAGKTEIAALIALFLAVIYSNEDVKIISPTYKQALIMFERIRDFVFSSEALRKLINKNKSFTMEEMNFINNSKIKILSAANEESLLGFGSTTLIIDESGSIKDNTFKTRILRMIANKSGNKKPILICLGTPHIKNWFFEMWNSNDVEKMKITWRDAIKEGRMSEEEIEFIRKRLTQEQWKVWYEAEFLEQDIDAIFGTNHINLLKVDGYEEDSKSVKYIGVDVARYGSDLSVISVGEEKNNVFTIYKWIVMEKNDLKELENVTYMVAKDFDFYKIGIDAVGLGAGVYDGLRSRLKNVYDFKANMPAYDEEMYSDIKSELLFELRKDIEMDKVKVADWKEDLKEQLLSEKYMYDSKGRVKFLDPPKSPDFLDSMLISYWLWKKENKKRKTSGVRGAKTAVFFPKV